VKPTFCQAIVQFRKRSAGGQWGRGHLYTPNYCHDKHPAAARRIKGAMSTTLPDYEGNYYSDSDKDEPELVASNFEAKQGTFQNPFRAPSFPPLILDRRRLFLQ